MQADDPPSDQPPAAHDKPPAQGSTATRLGWTDQLAKAAAILGAFFAAGQTLSQLIQGYAQHRIEEIKAIQEVNLARQQSDSTLATQFLTLVLNKDTSDEKRSMAFDALATLSSHPLSGWARARHDEIEKNLAGLQQARDAGLKAVDEKNAADGDLAMKKAKLTELHYEIELHREDTDKTGELFKEQTILVQQISLATATQARAASQVELLALGSGANAGHQARIASFHLPVERIRTALSIPADRALFDAYMPFMEAALVETGLTDKSEVAAVVATADIETNSFRGVTEVGNGQAWEGRKDLGNTQEGDGERFKGRGLIQLTGRANYAHYSELLGLGTLLVDMPDQANTPEVAARILCFFFKDRLPAVTSAPAGPDIAAIRRLVTGGTSGLPQFAAAYGKVLAVLD
jgi:predicted chitinase